MIKNNLGPFFDLNTKGYSLFLSHDDEEDEFCVYKKDSCSLYWKANDSVFCDNAFDANEFSKVFTKNKIGAKDDFDVLMDGISFNGKKYPVKTSETLTSPSIETFVVESVEAANFSEKLKFVAGGTTNIIDAYSDIENVFLTKKGEAVILVSSNICSVSYIDTGLKCKESFCYKVMTDAVVNTAKLISFFKDSKFTFAIGKEKNNDYFYIASDSFEAVINLVPCQMPFSLEFESVSSEKEDISISTSIANLKKAITDEKKNLPSALQKFFGVKAVFADSVLSVGENHKFEISSPINMTMAASDIVRLPFENPKSETTVINVASYDKFYEISHEDCNELIIK